MRNPLDILFAGSELVCPWWCCFLFDNPIRKLFHNPTQLLGSYVYEGFTVIDIGPGMGYFTIPLCRLVGESGKVIAVDVQKQMLNKINKRAEKAGVLPQLRTVLSTSENLVLDEKADFILTFWMVHEVPDQGEFFRDIKKLLKPQGQYLLVEPKIHVTERAFERSIEEAIKAGLRKKEIPQIALSRALLFESA
jgi:ubiquinone/menaquinone biosynthesis C-methylase UbiE